MNETIVFELTRDDVGQIIDGIEVLAEQWEATAEYLATGKAAEGVCIRESHSRHEAESIAENYRRISEKLSRCLSGSDSVR